MSTDSGERDDRDLLMISRAKESFTFQKFLTVELLTIKCIINR